MKCEFSFKKPLLQTANQNAQAELTNQRPQKEPIKPHLAVLTNQRPQFLPIHPKTANHLKPMWTPTVFARGAIIFDIPDHGATATAIGLILPKSKHSVWERKKVFKPCFVLSCQNYIA